MPWRLGSVSPSGTDISKVCKSDEKNKNSSILANISPRHILRPTPNGRKYSGLATFPSELMNLLGLNFSGSFQRVGSMWTEWRRGTTWAWDGTLNPFSLISLKRKKAFRYIRLLVIPLKIKLIIVMIVYLFLRNHSSYRVFGYA